MIHISIGQIIASNYIRYDRLTEMVNNVFANSSATKINLFIDINSCIKQMYATTFSLATLEEDTAIAAHIINMIAHYRRFFRTRYSVESDVYLVYSTNIRPEQKMFYFDYNKNNENIIKSQYNKQALLIGNLEILNKICPYLPDTSITLGTFETSVIIHDIISNIRQENVPNIVISRDIYATQLVAANDDVVLFRPKKVKQYDESYFVTKGGCIANLIADRQVNETPEGLDDGLLSFIMATSKLPERNVKSLLALPKAISLTKDVIRSGKVLNAYNSNISNIYELFPDKEKIQCIHGNIDSRFKAIDILYQHAIYINTPDKYFKPIQNLYDPRGIHTICNEYFKVNPLDLENL